MKKECSFCWSPSEVYRLGGLQVSHCDTCEVNDLRYNGEIILLPRDFCFKSNGFDPMVGAFVYKNKVLFLTQDAQLCPEELPFESFLEKYQQVQKEPEYQYVHRPLWLKDGYLYSFIKQELPYKKKATGVCYQIGKYLFYIEKKPGTNELDTTRCRWFVRSDEDLDTDDSVEFDQAIDKVIQHDQEESID